MTPNTYSTKDWEISPDSRFSLQACVKQQNYWHNHHHHHGG
jgi:hypothetical protein